MQQGWLSMAGYLEQPLESDELIPYTNVWHIHSTFSSRSGQSQSVSSAAPDDNALCFMSELSGVCTSTTKHTNPCMALLNKLLYMYRNIYRNHLDTTAYRLNLLCEHVPLKYAVYMGHPHKQCAIVHIVHVQYIHDILYILWTWNSWLGLTSYPRWPITKLGLPVYEARYT